MHGTDKYKEFLKRNIEETVKNTVIDNEDYIKIFLTKNDINSYLPKLNLNYEIVELPQEEIGGSKGINVTKNIEIDNTLKTLTQEEFSKWNGGYIFE